MCLLYLGQTNPVGDLSSSSLCDVVGVDAGGRMYSFSVVCIHNISQPWAFEVDKKGGIIPLAGPVLNPSFHEHHSVSPAGHCPPGGPHPAQAPFPWSLLALADHSSLFMMSEAALAPVVSRAWWGLQEKCGFQYWISSFWKYTSSSVFVMLMGRLIIWAVTGDSLAAESWALIYRACLSSFLTAELTKKPRCSYGKADSNWHPLGV